MSLLFQRLYGVMLKGMAFVKKKVVIMKYFGEEDKVLSMVLTQVDIVQKKGSIH